MSSLPVLLIQMRRLGDLILTFPLIVSLQKHFPSNPILFVGEENFYQELQPLVPGVRFLPPSSLPNLAKGKYELVINLDSNPEAARYAQTASADLKIGHLLDNGVKRIEGFWQLYQASLVGNNHHNLFHWGDLNRLDLDWPLPETQKIKKVRASNRRIGLFIGASEIAKRPELAFWVSLIRSLLSRGYKPVLLGGPSEKETGEKIALLADVRNANFCGKTSLAQLSGLLQNLDLLVTPDTGPMHLADWLGTPVLNLSMGNVQAWETGPIHPGQLVMRANMSCTGCWQCSRGKLYCRNAFTPAIVASAIQGYLNNSLSPLPGCELLLSGRDESGLYKLSSIEPGGHSLRNALDQFWQAAFLFFNNKLSHDTLAQKAAILTELSPKLVDNININIRRLLSSLLSGIRGQIPANIWKSFPRHLSLFAGFIEMSLQNESFSKKAISQGLELTARIRELFTR